MRLPCVCCEPLRIPLILFSPSSHSLSLSLPLCEKSDTRANCQRGYPCHLPLTSRGGVGHVVRSHGTSILYQSSGAPANGHREAFIYLPSKKSRQIPTLSCCCGCTLSLWALWGGVWFYTESYADSPKMMCSVPVFVTCKRTTAIEVIAY